MAQAIRDELLEELLQGYSSAQDLLGEEGLFKELKRRLLERALGAGNPGILRTVRGFETSPRTGLVT